AISRLLSVAEMKVIKGESKVFDLLKINVELFAYDTPLGLIFNEFKRGDDEDVLTDEEPYNLGEENISKTDEVAEICRIEVGLLEFETPICDAFKEFNYLSQVDVLTEYIPTFKTYDVYKDDRIYEWNDGIPWANEKPWTDDGE
nr:hypothetical protein [Tanacetum cinerariifolium]